MSREHSIHQRNGVDARMSETDREISRLFRISRTIHELVRDRVRLSLSLSLVQHESSFGADRVQPRAQEFEIAESEINLSLEEFRSQYMPSGSIE